MRCRPAFPWKRGFTLLEVMLAVALTALIFLLLGGVIHGMLSAERHIVQKTQATKFASGILSVMAKDLQACYIYQLSKGFYAESGDEPFMHFVTSRDAPPDPETGAWARTQEISYILKHNEEQPEMLVLFRRSQAGVDSEPFEGGTAMEIYDRILSFSAEYMNADGAWLVDWKAYDRLPLAVKIKIQVLDLEVVPEDTDTERIRAFETVVAIPCGGQEEP